MKFRKKTDVRRAGASLVATLPNANPPLIWRFDLERNHTFTLAMQGQDQEWELGVTSIKGEFHPVARFPERDDAEEAMASIGALLRNGGEWGSILGVLKLVAILIVLFAVAAVGTHFVLRRDMAQHSAVTATPAPVAPIQVAPPKPETPPVAPPMPPSGISLPADEVLKPPN